MALVGFSGSTPWKEDQQYDLSGLVKKKKGWEVNKLSALDYLFIEESLSDFDFI